MSEPTHESIASNIAFLIASENARLIKGQHDQLPYWHAVREAEVDRMINQELWDELYKPTLIVLFYLQKPHILVLRSLSVGGKNPKMQADPCGLRTGVSPFGHPRIKGCSPPPRGVSPARHVLHRRLKPRHPPYALICACAHDQFPISFFPMGKTKISCWKLRKLLGSRILAILLAYMYLPVPAIQIPTPWDLYVGFISLISPTLKKD